MSTALRSKKATARTGAVPGNGVRKAPAPEISSPLSEPKQGDLNGLFLSAVKDIYWAENHLVMNLPKIRDAAGKAPLKRAVSDHLEVTKKQVLRLEKVFSLLKNKPIAKKCDAMEGLVMEGEAVINSTLPGSPARDIGLIMACRKVEHFEMAAYLGLVALAGKLGLKEVAGLLQQTLDEESDSDKVLSGLAEKNY